MSNWNIVFNKLIEIKNEYIKNFGKISYEKGNEKSCLERFIKELDNPEYIELFKPVQTNQVGTMVLVRYGNYSDIFSGEKERYDSFWDKYNGFYQECRSVVIDIEKEIIILAPFKKFRNMDECEETSLDNIKERMKNAKSVEISNKLDGSMQSARYVPEYGRVVMSGSQALDRESSFRLEDGYRMLSQDINYLKMCRENPEYTFIFEYISLKDAHVVKYDKSEEGLYLIGMRNINTGKQLSYKEVLEYAKKYGVSKTTAVYNKTLDEALEDCKIFKSDEKEGFVINIDGFLVKLKTDDYVKMSKILSILSTPNIVIQNIADGTFDDFLSKVPDAYKDRVFEVEQKIRKYLSKYENNIDKYYKMLPKEDVKIFMIACDNMVPNEYRGYVRNRFLGKEYNLLKSQSGSYVKWKTIEVGAQDDYLDDVDNAKDVQVEHFER